MIICMASQSRRLTGALEIGSRIGRDIGWWAHTAMWRWASIVGAHVIECGVSAIIDMCENDIRLKCVRVSKSEAPRDRGTCL